LEEGNGLEEACSRFLGVVGNFLCPSVCVTQSLHFGVGRAKLETWLIETMTLTCLISASLSFFT
jgi:hypothetical protein